MLVLVLMSTAEFDTRSGFVSVPEDRRRLGARSVLAVVPQMIDEGKLPGTLIGKPWVLPRAAVQALAARQHPPRHRPADGRAVSTADAATGGTVGARCNSAQMEQSTGVTTDPTVQTITASALRIGDDLLDGPAVRHVTSVRLQGAPPEACVELAGVTGRRHYTATSRVQVHRDHVGR